MRSTPRVRVVGGWWARASTMVATSLMTVAVLAAGSGDESLDALVARGMRQVPKPELVAWNGTLRYRGCGWPAIFERSRDTPELRKWLFGLVESAEATLQEPLSNYVRPQRFDQIPTDRVDSLALQAGRNRDARALAMSDCTQTQWLLQKAVPLAVAARYTGRQDLTDGAVAILEQVATWVPFQRPGWSLGDASRTLPPEGDGPNMATAWGVSAVVDMLDILGDRVPPALRNRLAGNLRKEVEGIVRGWADRLPWYVQSRAVMSNQWVDPSVALVKACLYVGDADLLPAYNFGVENIAQTLAASREDGAFLEGMTYAQMSGGSVCAIVRAIAANGDHRCDAYPFIRRFWYWLLQMQMPGRSLVNCCDSKMSMLPDWAVNSPLSSMVDATLACGEPQAMSNLRSAFPMGNGSLTGIEFVAAGLVATEAPRWSLPNHAFFPSQQLLVWRSRYERPGEPQTALGLWVKGGSLEERSHGHRDQGQVSVYLGDTPILIDCGTPADYGEADLETRFAPAAGHGIMQIGEVRPRVAAVDAPLTVQRVDDDGGAVRVDTTRAYTSAKSCVREVSWSRSGGVEIKDAVQFLAPVAAGTEIFRFHSGSASPLQITGGGSRWSARWASAEMVVEADRDIRVEQSDWPDGTRPPFHHAVIRISCVGSVDALSLHTILSVRVPQDAGGASPTGARRGTGDGAR